MREINLKTWMLLMALGAIIALIIIYLIAVKGFGVPDGPGTFGDTFGAANALFSGLALAGVIIAILMQKQELELQRQELAQTREELKRSAEAQERSAAILDKQVITAIMAQQLSALSALVSYYEEELKRKIGTGKQSKIEEKLHKFVGMLEEKIDINVMMISSKNLMKRDKNVG